MGPWEACFGAELDWEKLWRDQVFGAKDDRDKWTQTCFGPEGFRGGVKLWQKGPGVRLVLEHELRQMDTNFFFSRDSEAAFGQPKCDHGRLILEQN